jgi:hypothetical protein
MPGETVGLTEPLLPDHLSAQKEAAAGWYSAVREQEARGVQPGAALALPKIQVGQGVLSQMEAAVPQQVEVVPLVQTVTEITALQMGVGLITDTTEGLATQVLAGLPEPEDQA